MSLTSWIAKRQTKEIIKGIIQAIQEMIQQLLTSKKTMKRKDTARYPIAIDNGYPTKIELEKKKAHDILKGNR